MDELRKPRDGEVMYKEPRITCLYKCPIRQLEHLERRGKMSHIRKPKRAEKNEDGEAGK